MNVSSSQNIDISAGQNLSLPASDELAEEVKGNSIKLNGDIDMKAKLINEKIIKKIKKFFMGQRLGTRKIVTK